MMRGLIFGFLVLAGGAGAATLEPLEDNPRIQREFLASAIGDAIRKNCPTISARMFRVFRAAGRLEGYALSLGYTKDDIKAMMNSRSAKARLDAMRDAYLAENGAIKDDQSSYCRLGYQEIENKSLTGWLLRAK